MFAVLPPKSKPWTPASALLSWESRSPHPSFLANEIKGRALHSVMITLDNIEWENVSQNYIVLNLLFLYRTSYGDLRKLISLEMAPQSPQVWRCLDLITLSEKPGEGGKKCFVFFNYCLSLVQISSVLCSIWHLFFSLKTWFWEIVKLFLYFWTCSD